MTVYGNGVGYENLEDLIAGKTPTLSGWTNNPTDAADITDGDISTFCTTGNKVADGAWQSAYITWDLGTFYDVFVSGFGCAIASANSPFLYVSFYDGSNWNIVLAEAAKTGVAPFGCSGCRCSAVRLRFTSNGVATITPNIREFHVWRL